MTVNPHVHVYVCNLCDGRVHVSAFHEGPRPLPEGWAELLSGGSPSFKHLCIDCLRSIDFARRPEEAEPEDEDDEHEHCCAGGHCYVR